MSDEQYIKGFQDNYQRVLNYTGGQDRQLMLFLACKYTLANKQFSGVTLQKIMDQIEGDHALPVRVDGKTSYKLAFHLQQKEDMHLEIQQLAENDNLLRSVKFKKSSLRLLGALFLQENKLIHAQRAKKLFDEMNRRQRILTSKEDIPYAVFLTVNPNINLKEQADTIMRYYGSLRNNQFMMGNSLQALAQILTVYSPQYQELLLQYVIKLRDELISRGIKVKRLHYPYLGVLALAATNDSKMEEITALYKRLIELKIFKHAKHYALIAAIQKVVQDILEVNNLVDIPPLISLSGLVDMVDFILEIVSVFPAGIAEAIDSFN